MIARASLSTKESAILWTEAKMSREAEARLRLRQMLLDNACKSPNQVRVSLADIELMVKFWEDTQMIIIEDKPLSCGDITEERLNELKKAFESKVLPKTNWPELIGVVDLAIAFYDDEGKPDSLVNVDIEVEP